MAETTGTGEAAIARAHLEETVANLPDGLDTVVGERGVKLSGGQKQRLSIARMFLKDPAILILDEATSALDTHTEQEIQSALDLVSKDRTTLTIAHRLSTIVDADEILVLKAGEIVERGSHRELMAAGGLYAEMWAMQREATEAEEALARVRRQDAAGVVERRRVNDPGHPKGEAAADGVAADEPEPPTP